MWGFFLADFGLTGAFLAVVSVGRSRLTGRCLFAISFYHGCAARHRPRALIKTAAETVPAAT